MKLGIDFGTSFSFVAEWRDENRAPQSRMRENIPTIFYYDEIHGEKIGKEAEQLMLRIPKNGVRNIKKYIIEKNLDYIFKLGEIKSVQGDYFIQGRVKEFTLREVVSKFIKILIDNVLASKNYYYPNISGAEEVIENIAVAIPVELNIEESWVFLQTCVAEAAGIPASRVYFIHEPVAAAMSYYMLNKNAGNRILVYDLGGGTVDAAVVARGVAKRSEYGVTVDDGGRYEVLAMYGEKIGGNDFDAELAEYIIDNTGHANERANLRVNISMQSAYGERFKKEVTETKEKLSRQESVSFAYEKMAGKIDITSGKFEELTGYLLEHTVLVTKRTLEVYKERYGQDAKLDAIVLSGGSSQMPMIMRRITRLCMEIKNDFPGLKIYTERPDCAISFGAAVYAANLDMVTFVAPYTYGVYIIGGSNFDMIYKNEPMLKKPDGRYILARKDFMLRTRELRAKVYEYSLAGADSPNLFKPTVDIYATAQTVEGRRSLAVELRLRQGRPVEARVFDKEGKEIKLEEPPKREEIKRERKREIKQEEKIQADIKLEVLKESGRREGVKEVVREKKGFINWLRRIWGKLFAKNKNKNKKRNKKGK